MTREQKRASFAWRCVGQRNCTSDYRNLVKGAPALVMSNGLMQALAFYRSKGRDHHDQLMKHLLAWLGHSDFEGAMRRLHEMDPTTYRRTTDEALAILKWLRLYASAAVDGDRP